MNRRQLRGQKDQHQRIAGCHTLEEFVASLKRPRRVMIMVKAGGPVDAVIGQLKPLDGATAESSEGNG